MQEPTAQGFEWRIMPDGERAAGRAGEGGATGLLAADGSGGAAGHPAEADGQPPTVYTPSNPVSDALRSPQSLKEGPEGGGALIPVGEVTLVLGVRVAAGVLLDPDREVVNCCPRTFVAQ